MKEREIMKFSRACYPV